MKNKKIYYLLGLLFILVLVLTILATLRSLKGRQEIRKEAAVLTGVASFSLNPQTSTVNVNQPLQVTIKFQSPSTPNNKGITGIRAVLSYGFSGENPLVITPDNIQGPLPSPWSYFNKEVSTTGETTTITINALYSAPGESGYTDFTTPKDFAILNFTAQHEGTVNLSFDPTLSKILAKDPLNEDILNSNLPAGTYTISTVEISPTPTPTIPPGEVQIQLKIKFAGIEKDKPENPPLQLPQQPVRVKVAKGNAILQDLGEITLTPDGEGIFTNSQSITFSSAITAGENYFFLIKGPKHLQTRYCQAVGQRRPCTGANITLNNELNTLDFTSYPLPPGDLPLPQDGVANTVDAIFLTNCFNTPTNQNCLTKADLDLSGNVNSADMNLLNLTIYSRWEDDLI